MEIEPVKIEGLKEFVANLKKIDGELPKAVRLAGNEAAGLVVSTAKKSVPLGPSRGGHARNSIKAKSTRTEARVQGGGKRFAYYPWLDFGGRAGRNRKVRRPFIREGRYIFPAYSQHADEVVGRYVEALVDVARQAGIELD
ncbi:hypothetical protein FHU38_000972 [Saccharomonospora amisosensis]|uniref:HK97 gp10 family phage protein n=1 Tax=Saccharomonospora amisosensis TaxID=1128677 RepID=A0A7X5ZPB6_9PSEU|nr:hypothetical protein [Saccharomonospora amisosensis]NIJ10628.1 hypothetical protein [Saccharomonospora amisosensis]